MATTGQAARVAIVVACHNDGATLRETLESLRREPGSELVVVDDGSTDRRTLDLLSELEREGMRILRQSHAGPAAAWMAGLKATAAGYVMPFSSDDVLVEGATAVLADALDARPEAAVVWGDMQSFGAASAYIPSAPVLCPWHVTYVNSRPGYALFRRAPLNEAGGWDADDNIEDWDLWMRLASRGVTGIGIPRLVFYYRRDRSGRFRSQVRDFERLYEQLRERNRELFAGRAENRRLSPAPRPLKILFPLIDRLPLTSRLLKVQLCDLATLVFWSAGVRRTARIVLQGTLFRVRLLGRGDDPTQPATPP